MLNNIMDYRVSSANLKALRNSKDRQAKAVYAILTSPLYERAREGEDVYAAIWALWASIAGSGLSNMTNGIVSHACKTKDFDKLEWLLHKKLEEAK